MHILDILPQLPDASELLPHRTMPKLVVVNCVVQELKKKLDNQVRVLWPLQCVVYTRMYQLQNVPRNSALQPPGLKSVLKRPMLQQSERPGLPQASHLATLSVNHASPSMHQAAQLRAAEAEAIQVPRLRSQLTAQQDECARLEKDLMALEAKHGQRAHPAPSAAAAGAALFPSAVSAVWLQTSMTMP